MKRIRHAVRYNIIYQLIVGSIAMLGLVYVWYSQGSSNLRAYVMALSNSWGLILVVIFIGYGMVDVPRRLWHKGDNARELRRIGFNVSTVKETRYLTESEVSKVAKFSDPLRRYVDRMVEDFPAVRGVQFESFRAASPILSTQGQRGDITGAASGATLGVPRMAPGSNVISRKHSMDALVPAEITEEYLADLHARIKRALRMNDRWTAIWLDLLKAGFLAQDIQDNMDNPEKKFRSSLRPLTVKPKEWRLSFEWVWHLKLRPILLRSLAVLCAVLSLLIVWSEMTYENTNPILSVIGLLVQMARDRMSYGAIEAVSFLTMLYMCSCAYTTLMKMKLLSNYVLVPNHHTDEPTLLFIGSYLCRLTFPLVYNYLTISAIGKEDSTEFQVYMGKIDMVPFLGEFNYYMPYLILIPTLITLFTVFGKIFAICNISDSFFDNDDDTGGIGGDVEEGLEILKDARRDEERRLLPERAGMNRDFTARRGAAFESYNNNKNNKNNKNRRRGDTATHSVLSEGSSANAWRDVRPYPAGTNQRPFQEPYFDDSTDEEDSSSILTGFGRRDSFDPFGNLAGGGSIGGTAAGSTNVGGSMGLGGGPASNRSSHRNLAKLDNHHQNHNNTQQPPTHMPTSTPGPFKSMWQKFVRPKQAIALDAETTSHYDPVDSDGARSSIESTGQNDHRPHHQHHPPQNQQHHTGRTLKPDRHTGAGRTGPALMFASVQQQPSAYGRSSLHDEDRDRLLSTGGENNRIPSNGSSAYSSRTHSPQGGMSGGPPPQAGSGAGAANGGGGRNSRPSSRVFGSSHPTGSGNNATRGSDNLRNGATGSHRQGSPLLNIFDDD
ncbi:LMBR1 domain-containing protein 2 [Dissophora ornata]|nr:LMBR1 domain-containing protein 2 [Dissophora ornata]